MQNSGAASGVTSGQPAGWADCEEADRERRDTRTTKPAQPCQNAHHVVEHQCGNDVNSERSDDEWEEIDAHEWKILISTDVVHKQAQYVARKGVTPAAFQSKDKRAGSLPPPSRGRSSQCTSLYF